VRPEVPSLPKLWQRHRAMARRGGSLRMSKHMDVSPQITLPPGSPASTFEVPASERQAKLQDFSVVLFRLLEELGLRYCLLTEPNTDRNALVPRLELMVHPEDRERLPIMFERLGEEGFLALQCLPLAANDCRYDFATSMDARPQFFSLIVREPFPKGLLFTTDGEIFVRRKIRGQCWVACEADEFCYLLSAASFEKKLTEPRQRRIQQLAKALGSSQAKRIAVRLFGDGLQEQVLAACASAQWDGTLERLGSHLRPASLQCAHLAWFVHMVLQLECALRRWVRPGGLYVVILGPDGAGKSTLTNKILELLGPLFECSRILQWRPQVIKPRPRYSPAVDPPHAKPPYGPLKSMIHMLAVLQDYWVGFPTVIWPLMKRNALAVFDRDFHDVLVDRLRYRYGGPDWFLRVIVKLSPAPETVFLTLDADPEVILARKNEVAPDELRRLRRRYLDLAAKLSNSTVIRTDENVETSNSAAMGALLTYLVRRFEYRHREVLPRPPRQTNGDRTTSPTVLSTARAGRNSYSVMQSLSELCTNWRVWFFKGSMAITDQGLISGSNFVLSIILACYLSASQYGTYAIAFSTFVLFSLVHQALVLEPMSVLGPSVYRASLRHYLGLLTWIQLGFSAIVVICLASVGIAGAVLGEPSRLTLAFIGMGVASPFVLLFWFARRVYYMHLMSGRAVIGAIAYSALLCVGIGALYYGRALSPFTAFLVMGASALLTGILLLIRLRSVTESTVTPARLTLRQVGVQHWRYGRWALVSMVFFWIPWNIFYWVVTRFSGLEATGTLRALLNLALPITATYGAFSLLFLPYTARLGTDGGWKAAKVQAWRIAGLFVIGSGAYWLVVCLFRNGLIHFLYKGQYAEVIPLVPVVAIASILSGAAMGPTIAIKAMRSPAAVSGVYFGSSLVSILVGIPACRAWGYRGAILAILLSSMTACIAGFLKCSHPKGVRATYHRSVRSKMSSTFSPSAETGVQQEVP
jgi:O-antigen/teichoic acid export membrane protein/thymidylate kinase